MHFHILIVIVLSFRSPTNLIVEQGIQHLIQLCLLFLSLLSVDYWDASWAGEHVFLITGTHTSVHHATNPLFLSLCSVFYE